MNNPDLVNFIFRIMDNDSYAESEFADCGVLFHLIYPNLMESTWHHVLYEIIDQKLVIDLNTLEEI